MGDVQEIKECNRNLGKQLIAFASMLEAFERAFEYADKESHFKLDAWSLFTQANLTMTHVLDAHEQLNDGIGRLP